MVENFKGWTIQSTISDSAHNDSDKQVDEINGSEEQVDTRNWLRNDSVEQVDQINYSNKQVDAISYYNKLVVTGSDPKSNQSINPKADTHTNNGTFAQKILISPFVPKIIPVVIWPINPPINANAMGVQDILSPRETVLPKASVTDAARSYERMNVLSNSVFGKTQKFVDLGLSPANTTRGRTDKTRNFKKMPKLLFFCWNHLI